MSYDDPNHEMYPLVSFIADTTTSVKVSTEDLVELLPNDNGTYLVDYDHYKNCFQDTEELLNTDDLMGNTGCKAEALNLEVTSDEQMQCEEETARLIVQVAEQPATVDPSTLNPQMQTAPGETSKTLVSRGAKHKITLEQYRKHVGIRVMTQKSTQKIGIAPDAPAKVEVRPPKEVNIPSPKGKGALCPHCGITSGYVNKCDRCKRVIDTPKIVDLPAVGNGSSSAEAYQISKSSFYGNRRPRAQYSQSARQFRLKIEEPQCVTLSSDDEDNASHFPESKKLKEGDSFDESKLVEVNFTSSPVREESLVLSRPPSLENTSPNPEPMDDMPASSSASDMQAKRVEEDTHTDLARWKEGGLKGPFTAVSVRSARMGSFKFHPSERVLFSSEGITLEAPVMDSNGQLSGNKKSVTIFASNILHVAVHFSHTLSVIFLNVTPSTSREISRELGLKKSDGTSPYWDAVSPDETQKRLTLLPDVMNDAAKSAIKQAFTKNGVYNEINSAEAHRILLISSPQEVVDVVQRLPLTTTVSVDPTAASPSSKSRLANKENGFKVEVRMSTRGSSAKAAQQAIAAPVEQMFVWSDGPDTGSFSVTTEDFKCLNEDCLLNDSIIDFYLRYVFSTKLKDQQKERCHVFSSFFYQRLTSRPPGNIGRKHPIEGDSSLSMAEKRHARVKSWTKKVDIFDKDFLFIPINEHSHWFLAVVCFPGLDGPVTSKDNRPVELPPQRQQVGKKSNRKPLKKLISAGGSFMIGNTTVTPVGSSSKTTKSTSSVAVTIDADRDEAETDEEETFVEPDGDTVQEKDFNVPEAIKQPCILFFDSLASCSHFRVAATLREYLMVEYRIKRGVPSAPGGDGTGDSARKLFSKDSMISACLDVPQQNNSVDCGIFVLQYAELFMKRPPNDFFVPRIDLKNWFPASMAGRKRKDLRLLLIRLTKERNPLSDNILRLLPQEDVRLALSDQQDRRASPVESDQSTLDEAVMAATNFGTPNDEGDNSGCALSGKQLT